MTDNPYFGVRKMLFPNQGLSNNNLLWSFGDKSLPDELFYAIKIFKDKPVFVVYNPSPNNSREFIRRDNFTGCIFVGGYLKSVSDHANLCKRELELSDDAYVSLDRVVDVVSSEHMKELMSLCIQQNASKQGTSKDLELKVYNFISPNVNDNTIDYNIVDYDPILAYMSAKNNNNGELKLASITPVYQGMQFNRGKGR